MQRRRNYHHGNLRDALVTAAMQMLEKEGPEAISFRALARTAGVSQTAPYNHFESKEDLLATVARLGFRELVRTQRATAAAETTGEKRIIALGLDYIRFALAQPQLYRLMFGAGVTEWQAHPEVAEAKAESFLPVSEALAQHLGYEGKADQATIETTAISAWALVHGLSMLLIDRTLDPAGKGPGDAKTLASRVVTSFVEGLKNR